MKNGLTILESILIENKIQEYSKFLANARNRINKLAKYKKIYEGILDFDTEDLSEMFDEAIRRLQATKRGLSLANKLLTPEERKKHRSRIMTSMNRLRNFIRMIEFRLQQSEDLF